MKTTPKDFFVHIGATIALYVCAVALINLAFTVINYVFPDVLSGYFYASSVVWPISVLIVLTPVLYVLEWFLAKDIRANSEKRQVWIRRWRIYLTLFLTGATIAGDLIALINTYLSGEISIRFVWKIVAVLVVSAVIFTYFILEKMSDNGRGAQGQKILSWVGIVLVLATIISGFVIVGSPAKQRAIRFDSTRMNDLSSLQYQVINYWQRTEKLPATLEALKDDVSGYKAPTDPATMQPYEYKITGDKSFELCATFALSSKDSDYAHRGSYGGSYGGGISTSYPSYGGIESNWDHQAGRSCFQRTIDPTQYRPYKNSGTTI